MKIPELGPGMFQGGRDPLMETLRKSWLRVGVVTPPNPALNLQTFTVTSEESALIVLSGCYDIKNITSQNPKLTYGPGNSLVYTPDCTVETQSGRIDVIEVKPLKFATPEKIAYYGVIEQAYEAQGQTFLMWLAEDITRGYQFENWNILRPYGRYLLPARPKDDLLSQLAEGATRLGELLKLATTNADKCSVYGMLQRGEITFDAFQRITEDSFVSLPDSPFPRLTYENLIPRDWRGRILELQNLAGGKKFRDLSTLRITVRPQHNGGYHE